MQLLSAYLTLLAATSVVAVPLNINLGAYSPALVVGDGEISFGGGESAEALLSTLAGFKFGDGDAAGDLKRSGGDQEAGADGAVSPALQPVSEAKKRDENSPPEKRGLEGFKAALKFASEALKTSPGVELGTGEGGSGVGIIVKPGSGSSSGHQAGEAGGAAE